MSRRRKKTSKQYQRARKRQQLREHRARVAEGIAIYLVACDGDVLDLLVRRGYLTDDQVIDKSRVNMALSKLLWDLAHNWKPASATPAAGR